MAKITRIHQPQAKQETKAEKWLRVFPRRLANAKRSIELLKQGADREFYDVDEAQWTLLISELVTAVDDVLEAYQTGGKVRHRNIFQRRSLEELKAEIELRRELQDVL